MNLLPKKEKIEVLKSYRMRRLIVVLACLFATEVICIVSLFPSFVFSRQKFLEVSTEAGKFSKSEIASGENAKKILAKAFSSLNSLKDNQTVPVYETITKILNEKGNGIRIENVIYERNSNTKILNISGVARDRESLVSFGKNVSESGIGKVDLPVSNFAENKDINFSLQITIEQK